MKLRGRFAVLAEVLCVIFCSIYIECVQNGARSRGVCVLMGWDATALIDI